VVTIRLQRRGKIHEPFFHIVAADSHRAVKGEFIERLGYYDPKQNPSLYKYDEARIRYWYGKGAKLSDAVANIMKKQKLVLERDKTKTAAPAKAKKAK
jgi:small subunit ribosomal protein S16